MNNEILSSSRSSEKIELSLHIDSELVEKIKHLSNNPSKIVETALKE